MEQWIAFAGELARESGKLIMRHFGRELAVEQKSDRSPVTVADREAEALMRGMILERFPDHGVLGEEGGASGNADSPHLWVIDPIDGTKSFIHGVPLFGTLIALLENGRPVLGAIHLPVTEELLVGAEGRQTTLNGRPVRVSTTRKLSEATVLYTGAEDLYRLGHGPAFAELQERAGLVRGWGDCYGHFLVATGRADVMFDPILSPWDIAPLRPCIEGAGGRLTDVGGQTLPLGESALCSNGLLHQEALALLSGKS
ncbi:MAG: histidinol-phosphatase [bacterium]